MRQKIVAGNWKMNTTYQEGLELASGIAAGLEPGKTTVVLCPPFIHLTTVRDIIRGIPSLKLGAQNCHQEPKGAYTGEVSVDMLKSIGVDYVILGHSERREFFKESDSLLGHKVDIALSRGLHPIFCCGEHLDIREKGTHLTYVENQLRKSLFHLPPDRFRQVVIAYEPIWAIGTGRTATPEQAQEMHAHIRSLLSGFYGDEIGQQTAILYGGSVNSGNAASLFGQPDVDGGLVGGASLKAGEFLAIVQGMKHEA